ncbi:MAG: VTT domain-containing protein [Nitrososphaerales archaeon]
MSQAEGILDQLTQIVLTLGYLGAFLSGFLGSSSLFISVFPSFIVVPFLATQLNPLLIGILAGLGAGLGQFLHYYVGLGGRKFLGSFSFKRLDKYLELMKNKLQRYTTLIVFLFAVTPLTPDDIIWIPLGLMRHPKLKPLLAAMAGKVILNLIYAYAGFYGWEFIKQFF